MRRKVGITYPKTHVSFAASVVEATDDSLRTKSKVTAL